MNKEERGRERKVSMLMEDRQNRFNERNLRIFPYFGAQFSAEIFCKSEIIVWLK